MLYIFFPTENAREGILVYCDDIEQFRDMLDGQSDVSDFDCDLTYRKVRLQETWKTPTILLFEEKPQYVELEDDFVVNDEEDETIPQDCFHVLTEVMEKMNVARKQHTL